MRERDFNKYKRSFQIMCNRNWANLDKAELESLFNESLAKAYLTYDESIGAVKFSTYLENIIQRDVYINLIRPYKYSKNQAEFVDIYSLVDEDKDADNFFVDTNSTPLDIVVSRETMRELDDSIQDFISFKIRGRNHNKYREKYNKLFDMWKDEMTNKEISIEVGIDYNEVCNIKKSFRLIYRNKFKK